GINGELNAMMVYDEGEAGRFNKGDMITLVVTAAMLVLNAEGNAAKLDKMLKTNGIVEAILNVIEGSEIVYATPDWNYMDGIVTDDGIEEYVNAIVAYPNDWTEEKAQYLATNLPTLVDTVIKMVEINGVKYDSLAALLQANVNVFTADTLNSLVGLITGLLKDIDDGLLEAAGVLLGADVVGLKSYKAPETVDTVKEFADELANILNTYAKGVVEWLLLGKDYKFFVKENENKLPVDAIVINGANGYAEGLALLLEALGCESLPAADGKTEDIVSGVLDSLAARIDEILANPVEEVLDLLPNLIYFLDADGVDAVITNTTAALTALVGKLSTFGISLDINSLVNLPALMGIEDKYAEGDDVIALNNLTLRALLKALSLMTGLDFTELQNVLVPFALGEAIKYDSVSSKDAYKMVYKTDLDKHDMITVVVTAALRMFVENEDNAAKLDEMLGTEIISALKNVFADVEITYEAPNWEYVDLEADGTTVSAMQYAITYPNNWTEATAEAVLAELPALGDMIANMIDSKYSTLSDLLNDKVNVFTSDNLNALVALIANLLKDIDDGLLDAAGVLLGVDVVGLKAYKAPEGITTVDAFAAELADVLNTYAKGVVEWLLLGKDYKFFVKEVKDGAPVDFIVINGANGYANGLALLLEAIGCKNLPAATGETEAVVTGVLGSLAARIDEILDNPVEEVINLLPNLFYFLNTNGVAAVVENTLAAVTALLEKLEAFGIKVDIKALVNLKKLMKIENTDARISLDDLSMVALLEAVSYMIDGFDLTHIKNLLVGFGLGKIDTYTSVSDAEAVGTAKKMSYKDEFDKHDMLTVLVNMALITLADDANAEFLKKLAGEDIYAVILNVLNLEEALAEVKKMSWLFTDKANTGEKFSPMKTSELYKGFEYGPNYTREMAQYIADNFGTFVDNIIKLLGIQINGKFVNSLSELLNNLVGGSVYNSSNVIAIRDALAGVLAGIGELKVEGVNVGKYIKMVLVNSLGVDLDAVAAVEVPEFTDNRDLFAQYLCKVLDPLGPILKWLLTNEEIAFFVDLEKKDFITLPGAEGYKNGIVLLLEALGCENIVDPANLDEDAKGADIVNAIIDPLLNRVDEILANPAEEIFAILPNLVYFINSNGVDVVVKNTLNAVYTVLNAIEPIAKIDLYKLIGLDLETLTFEKLIEMLLGNLEIAGFSFKGIPMDAVAELTVGTLETYDSLSAEVPAYRMVYGGIEAEADMVTAILRLLITFATTEGNQKAIVDLLKSIGLTAEGEKYLAAMIEFLATCIADTKLGMDAALYSIYYVYYGVDKGAAEVVKGKDDLSKQWVAKLEELNKNSPNENAQVGDLLTDIFDIIFGKDENGNNGVLDDKDNNGENGGVASQGGLTFFQKIAKFFQEIAEFFRNLFSFGKK
ncbi:MAG: hypothetical protein IIW88_07670, partial [Clostridia bacterium]|nr:hypothetical protein [Clostridia bacterium]